MVSVSTGTTRGSDDESEFFMAGWMVRGKMALLLARDRPRGDRLTTGRGHTHTGPEGWSGGLNRSGEVDGDQVVTRRRPCSLLDHVPKGRCHFYQRVEKLGGIPSRNRIRLLNTLPGPSSSKRASPPAFSLAMPRSLYRPKVPRWASLLVLCSHPATWCDF